MRYLEVLLKVPVESQRHSHLQRRAGGASPAVWLAFLSVLVVAYTRSRQPAELVETGSNGGSSSQANGAGHQPFSIPAETVSVSAPPIAPIGAAETQPSSRLAVPSSSLPGSALPNRVNESALARAGKAQPIPAASSTSRSQPPPSSAATPSGQPSPNTASPAAELLPAQVPATVFPRTTSSIGPGKLIKKVVPIYPAFARQNRISGTVRLRAVVSTEGRIKDIQLVSGEPLLIEAAIQAVRQWVYQPWILDGKPVEVNTNIDVSFKLTDVPE
jgi:protein TonB